MKTIRMSLADPVKTIIWVILFSIAMAFLESAVVIYLRELYYKTGFVFPLTPIPAFIARVEFFRELATVVMLLACGLLAGKGRLQRFAFFMLAFAIWDLFYYIFLYLCLGWPQSLRTWDILFLIPVPWVGPVWAPCSVSLLMIVGSGHIIFRTARQQAFQIPFSSWWMISAGAFICIVSFMWDYLEQVCLPQTIWTFTSSDNLFAELGTYIPSQFNIPLFLTGFLLMCLPLLLSILKPDHHENQ